MSARIAVPRIGALTGITLSKRLTSWSHSLTLLRLQYTRRYMLLSATFQPVLGNMLRVDVLPARRVSRPPFIGSGLSALRSSQGRHVVHADGKSSAIFNEAYIHV
jgi:hypothetical protein